MLVEMLRERETDDRWSGERLVNQPQGARGCEMRRNRRFKCESLPALPYLWYMQQQQPLSLRPQDILKQ